MIRKGTVALVLAALMTCCAALANDAGIGRAAPSAIAPATPPRLHCRIYFGCLPAMRPN